MITTRTLFVLLGGFAIVAPGATTLRAQGRGMDDRSSRISGTYELDARQSDNAQRVVDQATRSLPPGQRDRVAQSFLRRLDAPQTLAIDINGRSVSMMSSNAPRIEFEADGRNRTESGADGRPVTTRANIDRNRLVVSTSGNRGTDFSATFERVPGGLRVTRRLDSDYQDMSVTVQSTYRRVADPRWNVYDNGRGDRGGPPRVMLVPEGMRLTARLNHALSNRSAHEGERFTMTVTGRGEYAGAVINGLVARTTGRAGRADMSFDFDGIRLRDGRAGPFEGGIESVRMPDGSTVRVDRSGAVQDQSRSGATPIQGGAVGAGLGAIIGAIAGGGKGAVIGAVVGGGAGMVIVEGRSDLNLPAGTEMVITSLPIHPGRVP